LQIRLVVAPSIFLRWFEAVGQPPVENSEHFRDMGRKGH
jgi:hypothetical protein